MNRIVFCFFLLLSFSAQASESSWNAVRSIDFNHGKAGISTFAAKYFAIDLKTWKVTELKKEPFLAEFPQSKSVPEAFDLRPAEIHGQDTFKLAYDRCQEQEDGSKSCNDYTITFTGGFFKVPVSEVCQFGCSIMSVDRWGDQLWFGLGNKDEDEIEPIGVHVYNTKSSDPTALFKNEAVLATVIRKEPDGKTMWVGGPHGILRYNQHFIKKEHFCFFNGPILKCK